MASKLQLLSTFKTQLISFCEELCELLPDDNEEFILLKIFIDSQIPIELAMQNFIRKINKNEGEVKNMIKERNDQFFLTKNVFKFVSKEKINKLSSVWNSNKLDAEDKDAIWRWMELFVNISVKYQQAD
jgi:hypothetical protein